jgi:hypothetical protein
MQKGKRISFSAILERSTNNLWGAHVRVPELVAQQMTDGKRRRVICSFEGSRERQCALLPIGNRTTVIAVNKQLRHALGLAFGDRVRLTIRKDSSRYGLPMPTELAELLRQDKRAHLLFQSLTPGRRRTLLHIVGSVQNPGLRLHRANVMMRHLTTNNGRINYREVYRALKR